MLRQRSAVDVWPGSTEARWGGRRHGEAAARVGWLDECGTEFSAFGETGDPSPIGMGRGRPSRHWAADAPEPEGSAGLPTIDTPSAALAFLAMPEAPAIDVRRIDNVAARALPAGRPVSLSVVVPFFNTSPRTLLAHLARCRVPAEATVEVLFADDGSADPKHWGELSAAAEAVGLPCSVLVLASNRGRSRVRNLLAATARGDYVLFVDCDMRLPSTEFLAAYLTVAASGTADVAYGGFRMAPHVVPPDDLMPAVEPDRVTVGEEAPAPRRRDGLHAYFGRRANCLATDTRRSDPERHTFTNNLLVRRSVALAHPFDEGFRGWGWEDVEWALTVAEHRPIVQVDNPVVDPANDRAEQIVRKFEESIGNFRRLAERHPEQVRAFTIYRASRVAAAFPRAAGAVAPLLRAVVCDRVGVVPLWARYAALKLYRACLYRHVHLPDGA